MRKQIILTTLLFLTITTLVVSTPLAFAGWNNQNDATNGKSVERGTGKVNGLDGCRPGVEAGNYMVTMFSDAELDALNALLYSLDGAPFLPPLPPGTDYWQFTTADWAGGPCCPSNVPSEGNYPLPNQCCNPPDIETPEPGNHCLCFELRGYPFPNAAIAYPYE